VGLSISVDVDRPANGARRPSVTLPDAILYVLSPSFSGSTLLTLLIAQHPAIATIGELKAARVGATPGYKCSCGGLLTDCEFWRELMLVVAQRGGKNSLDDLGTHFSNPGFLFRRLINAGVHGGMWPVLSDFALHSVPACRRALVDILQQNILMMQVISELQQGRVFLDASKDPARLRVLQRHFGRRIKVVRLLRDGRGIANSYMKHYGVSMAVAGREVAHTFAACDRLMDRIASADKLTLRYENLCDDPEAALQRIFALASLEPVAEADRRSLRELHILGNVTRLDGSSIRLDEKWRAELSHQDLATFNRIAGHQNEKYGYGSS
jgi:hypothetical protein